MSHLLRHAGACLTLLLGLAAGAARAQQAAAPVMPVPIKFGQPNPADFEAKNFAADSGAAAVVLSDVGLARFRVVGMQFKLETERTTRLKVLKKAGYEYATVEIPLYHSGVEEEKLTGLKAFTYNMVGGKLEKVKLDVGTAFTEERTKNVRVRKLTLPGVREGSVIEYQYSVLSDFFFNLQPWTFQRDIPTRWSEFRAIIPEYFTYKILMQGYEPLALQTTENGQALYTASERAMKADGGVQGGGLTGHEGTVSETFSAPTTNYHWAMQDVPALREEPYMTTPRDYVARIDFELASTRMPGGAYHAVANGWQKINADLLASDEFGGLLDRAGFLKEQVQPLIAQLPDPAARAAAVRALILHNVACDGVAQLTASGSLKHTWEQHRGTAADVNLLLIAAARLAELPVQPVILSTRAHGRVSQSFPQLNQFNYVVGLLPLPADQQMLLDATEPMLPCGVLPARCLSQVGRLVVDNKDGEGHWVPLTPNQRHSHYQQVTMTLDPTGNLTGKVHEEHGGYQGVAARQRLAELGEKKYVTELASQHPNWEIPSYKFDDAANVGKPLALTYEVKQAATSDGTAQELYLKPLAAFGESRNPFSHATRKYPVDLGAPTQEVVVVTLNLPPGYVAELPKPANVALPDQGGLFVFAASSPTPGTVQLTSRLSLLKPVYGAGEYASLREFYRLALAKQAEAVVVKKQ